MPPITGMKMFYKREGKFIEYAMSTDPCEAMYWSTYRLKKGDISLVIKLDKSMTALLKQEILDDIISREPNPSKKSTPPTDEVQKRRQTVKPQHDKKRQAKPKAR
jgi:hypothetical protein